MEMKLIVPDSVILKLHYETSEFHPGDSAYDIAQTILEDEVSDTFTYGFLLTSLMQLSDSLSGKVLLDEFINLVNRVRK